MRPLPSSMQRQWRLVHPVSLIPPAAVRVGPAPVVSGIIDLLGYDSATLLLTWGAVNNGLSAFSVSLEHGDDAALSDAAAPGASDLIGSLALAAVASGEMNCIRKLGYVGSRRFLRLTVTPSAACDFLLSAIAVLGNADQLPTINPPT